MSYYDDASLVVIPSGYKTSKVYAEKPTDGSGDLAFTRTGDTATRVNSAGLIEKVRTNLLTYSNTFSNAAWTKVGGTTLTAGQTDYLGGTNAWKWEATGAATIQLAQNPAGSAIRTASIYAKAGNVSTISLWIGSAVTFNLSTGTVTSGTGVITSVGNGWYRCSAFGADISHNPYFIAANSGDYVLVSFAQLETGDIATAYIPTTTAAVSVGPVANVPRLDYLGSTCPRLLLEPQRTNLLQFSEQIDNAYWTKQDASITANTSVSPDGYTNADSLIENSATAQHLAMRTAITITTATAYTASVYFKANTRTRAAIQLAGTGFFDTANGLVIFNLSTGAIISQTGNATGTITSVGNGWYRCTATKTSVGTSGVVAFNLVDSSNNTSYAGNGTSGVFLWGAQLEVGAYATSYIPTLAASATRGADACSKTGISSLIGQTEGVAFIDFVWNGLTGVGSYPRIIELATDANNIIQLYSIAGTTTWGWDIINGGVVQFTGSSTMALGRNKIAIGYKLNDMVVYRNGTLLASDTSCTVPATSALGVTGIFNGVGGAQLAASVNQTLLFKTRLTNAEMQELTTL